MFASDDVLSWLTIHLAGITRQTARSKPTRNSSDLLAARHSLFFLSPSKRGQSIRSRARAGKHEKTPLLLAISHFFSPLPRAIKTLLRRLKLSSVRRDRARTVEISCPRDGNLFPERRTILSYWRAPAVKCIAIPMKYSEMARRAYFFSFLFFLPQTDFNLSES